MSPRNNEVNGSPFVIKYLGKCTICTWEWVPKELIFFLLLLCWNCKPPIVKFQVAPIIVLGAVHKICRLKGGGGQKLSILRWPVHLKPQFNTQCSAFALESVVSRWNAHFFYPSKSKTLLPLSITLWLFMCLMSNI